MNPLGLLVRMKRLAQHPPSWNRVLLGFGVAAFVAAIAGIEALGWWPDWATATRARALP